MGASGGSDTLPGEDPKNSPAGLPSRGRYLGTWHFSWVFLLKHAQAGKKNGIVSGAFMMDTDCMKCFLVGWEPVCLQEQLFEEAKKTHTGVYLL